MSAVALQGGRRKVHRNRYQWPLLAAVLLLLAERCISTVRPNGKAVLVMLAVVLTASAPARADEIRDGINAYEKGDYSAAIEHFTAGQVKNPQDPKIMYNLGNAFYKEGDYDSAETHLREALAAADPYLKAKIHYNLGNIDFRKGRLKEAIENYRKALEFTPDDQQTEENIEFVKKVMEQKPPQSQNRNQNQDQNQEQNQQEDPSKDQKQSEGKSQQADNQTENSKKENSSRQKSAEADQNQKQDQEKEREGQQALSSDEMDSNQQPPPASPEAREPAKENLDESLSQNGPEKREPSDKEKQRAQRLLNRLKDQPGRATMPAYGETPVDKDW
jgi:Ca-activated chloride channel family protein